MEPFLEEMAAFFDRRCEIYDEVHTNSIDGGIESKRVPARYLPERAKTLLDLGIGTGLELEAVFARFPDVQVTGLDISSQMLQKLQEKYPGRLLRLIQASYLDYPFEYERYDAALSVMTLHHYTHEVKLGLYRRIYSALNSGGIYVECDYMLSEQEFANPQAREDAFFAEYSRLKRLQDLDEAMEYHFDTPCTVQNQKQLLLAAGFRTVDEVWRRKNTVVLTAIK